jgi:hemerythrin superfamily protein
MPKMPRAAARSDTDPIAMLKQDHDRVNRLFKRFEKINEADPETEMIVREICAELQVHAAIEEEIFYPAAREVLQETSILNEAEVEHWSIKNLVDQLEAMDAGDTLFVARAKVLAEYVRHHVEEEEGKMFPRLKKSKLLDASALADEMRARRSELQQS